MKVVSTSSADEVVLAWLKAELDSPRFKDQLLTTMKSNGDDLNLITQSDLTNPIENKRRLELLSTYRNWLDKDFSDYSWNLVDFDQADAGELQYIDYDYWNELSNDTHLVKVAAENVIKGISVFDVDNEPFFLVAEKIDSGDELEPIIVLGKDEGDLRIIEGHVRATAFVMVKSSKKSLKALVGMLKK